ncbi:MAG TPA: ribbon-helix-helix protein, CopG family [bacterium]|nr:ribbon-helix-helix protein, CopG family [bacterium]
MLTVQLDAGLEQRLEHYAAAHSMNISDAVREALLRYLEDAEDAALAESALREMCSSQPLAEFMRPSLKQLLLSKQARTDMIESERVKRHMVKRMR